MTDAAPIRRLDRRAMKERTRERLLDAAEVVFARRGIEAASLDEVAEEAGYTKGAIYSNFSSKTDLIGALMARRISQQAAAVEASLDGVTLEEGLRILEELPRSEAAEHNWAILATEFFLYSMRDARAQVVMAEQYERARTLTATMLAAMYAESGAEPPLPPRDLAIVIEAVGIGVTLQSLLDPTSVPAGLAARGVELILSGGRPAEGGT